MLSAVPGQDPVQIVQIQIVKDYKMSLFSLKMSLP